MEKKYFETVDCNVELPKVSKCFNVLRADTIYPMGVSFYDTKVNKFILDDVTHWLRELPTTDSPKVSDDMEKLERDVHMLFSENYLGGYDADKIIDGLMVMFKASQTNDAEMVEFAEWLGLNEYDFIQGCWYYLGHTTNLTTTELLNKFKTRNK